MFLGDNVSLDVVLMLWVDVVMSILLLINYFFGYSVSLLEVYSWCYYLWIVDDVVFEM